MDIEKIQRINKLAKTLKDTGMAKTMDEAVKMAEEMTEKGEEAIKEEIAKEEAALEEPEEEKKEPFILKKPEEKEEEIQKEISPEKEKGE